MKNITKSISALFVTAVLVTAPAYAYTIEDISEGETNPDVMVTVEGELVILEGKVGSTFKVEQLEMAALELEGINGVLSYLSVSE